MIEEWSSSETASAHSTCLFRGVAAREVLSHEWVVTHYMRLRQAVKGPLLSAVELGLWNLLWSRGPIPPCWGAFLGRAPGFLALLEALFEPSESFED